MSGIGRGTRGIDTKFLYSLLAGVITPLEFTDEVGDITSVGDIADTASTTEVNIYGQGYTNTFTTVKSIGQIDLEFIANSEDDGQKALELLYTNQETAAFDVRMSQGAKQTDYMFDGQVSAFTVTTSADDIVRYAVSIVVHGAATKVSKAS
jgi:hypothetical protein